ETRSMSCRVWLTVKAGRARTCSAISPTPQFAASSALRSPKLLVLVPIEMVFHTGVVAAEVISRGEATEADGRSALKFCRTARGEHCAPASVANNMPASAVSAVTKAQRADLPIHRRHWSFACFTAASSAAASIAALCRSRCEAGHRKCRWLLAYSGVIPASRTTSAHLSLSETI